MKKEDNKGMSRRSFQASSFMLAGSYAMAACSRHNEAINNLINSGKNGDQDENNGNTESKVNPFDFEKKTVMLNSGYEMPIIGIGTYLLSTAQAEESVYNALHSGMRLIDTADIYGNERGVARGIQRTMTDFGIRREDIFVTSKLWTSSFNRADEEVDERLERLELEYVDLLLLHHAARDDEHAYQAMERGVKAGKLHSIGISNFYEDDVNRLMNIATIPPAVLQNRRASERNPPLPSKPFRKGAYCTVGDNLGIVVPIRRARQGNTHIDGR